MNIKPLLLSASLALCACTGAYAEELLLNPTCRSDLDGDGIIEELFFELYISPRLGPVSNSYAVEVNGKRQNFDGVGLTGKAYVVDLDSTDTYLEIAVPESGPSDDPATHFLRYINGRLVEIGSLPGIPHTSWANLRVDGSGVVATRCRGQVLHTWFYNCEYRVERNQFVRVQQALYPMNSKLVALQELELAAAIGSDEVAVVVWPGQTIVVVETDDVSWCRARVGTSATGWFELVDGCFLADGRKVWEVFEGLVLID